MPDGEAVELLLESGVVFVHDVAAHVGRFLQGLKGEIIPLQYEVFGPDWCSAEEIRDTIGRPHKISGDKGGKPIAALLKA